MFINLSRFSIILIMILPFCLTACRAEPLAPPTWNWNQVETGLPRRAIVTAVAADPLNSDHLWAGYYATGGLMTSHDGGQTWQMDLEGVADNPVFDLLPVIDTVNGRPSREVWAATPDGLWVSADAGMSWQPVSKKLPPMAAFALAADAEGRVYVGLEQGIYAQTLDRTDWQPLADTGSSLAEIGVISLAVSSDGQALYAGTSGGGLFSSRDGGQTWNHTYPAKFIPNIALDPAQPHLAVASLREETIADEDVAREIENLSTQDYLIRTTNGGQTWQKLPLAWANDEVTSLLWRADGTLGAATGKGQLFSSRNGGETWQGGVFLPGGGVLDLAAAGETRLLAASWTGLYASDDGGQTWQNLAPKLGTPQANALLAANDSVLLGTQTGLYRWQAEADRWQQLVSDLSVTSLAAAPGDHPLYLGTIGDGVYRSNDAGTNWEKLPGLGVGVPELAINPQNPAHLVLLAAWERPYETVDAGSTWNARWAGLGNEVETVSLAIDPLDRFVYVGTEAGLYVSPRGNIWQPVALNLLNESILALSPQINGISFWNRSVLYIGTTRGVYRSFDHGATVQGPQHDPGWGYGLENVSVTAFLVDPNEPRLLLAGTAYHGVYQSVDGGETWHPIGPAAVREEIIESMAWGPGGELFFATPQSVWRGER